MLRLSRARILSHRLRAGLLEERQPKKALRRAAWAGLQDSMPRAAWLSIHARIAGSPSWEDPSLVQIWGPRYSAYVVPERDVAVFTLGRLPEGAGRRRAEEAASKLKKLLGERRMRHGDAGRALGVVANSLRYATTTGTVRIRWDGAHQPTIWVVPAPAVDPLAARVELASRYLHVFGPSTAEAFAVWAGTSLRLASDAFAKLELAPVRTPIGDAWILASDEPSFSRPSSPASARLLPSGDAFYLLQGADRELLVPDAAHRASLWTTRVWPGAILSDGDIVGTWRRAGRTLTLQPWRRLARAAIEAEAAGLPLPGPLDVRWLP